MFDHTRNAGHLIVDLACRASSYYGPSAVASEIAEAIVMDTGRLLSVSHMLTGQFNIKDVALSLPAVIGKNGVKQTVKPFLSEDEVKILQHSASEIAQIIKEANNA